MASIDIPHTLMEPVTKNEEDFRRKLLWHCQLMRLLEDSGSQQHALKCVPVDDLTIKASQVLSTLKDNSCLEDCLILELLQWFKYSFFSWVDAPACSNCNQPTESKGFVKPLPEESAWLARNVENYFCPACNMYTRFPRYNHPKKLLGTRKGRCGEWGICFTLICRALDFDARLVVDWTDHLWTEVFSPSQQKWVHCDPCENVCDQPLMYELGWKKKLTFIIAFSKDEVQDVTWRYTCHFARVLKRRLAYECRESFILSCINYCTLKCRAKVPAEKLDFLVKRQLVELAGLLMPPKASKKNHVGRTSGSEAWRLARGEISAEITHDSYVFKLSEIEVEKRYFHLQYNCALDEYVRVSDNYSKYEKWDTCTAKVEDIFRKVELDWKTVYLARSEEFTDGIISWKFDFENSGLVVQKLRLNLLGTKFHFGKIKWSISSVKISGEHTEVFFTAVPHQTFSESKDFKGAISLVITAELYDGFGPQAWQHSQLFRQPLDSTEIPFEVEIYFDKL